MKLKLKKNNPKSKLKNLFSNNSQDLNNQKILDIVTSWEIIKEELKFREGRLDQESEEGQKRDL